MANEVFANDLEIACKAADGKSVACFPDPCFSPPSPSAGWILIPYANTAYAKDTTNASKTVFISGKPIMKKDVSYFKKSTGNEPAAGPKGQFTGVKKGKAYFTSWSMNVKVEGHNVDRHTDGMTHNHGSQSGNTGVWHYWDDEWGRDPCNKEFKRVEKACGGMKKKNNRKGDGIFDSNWKQVTNKGGDWKRKHCKFHNLKPSSPEAAQEALESLKKLPDIDGAIKKAVEAAADYAVSAVMDKIVELGVKAVAKKVLLGATGVGIVIAVADGLADAKAFKELYDLKNLINNELKKLTSKLTDLKSKLQSGADFSETNMADAQDLLATADDCLRARKCMLVPFNEAKNSSGNKQSNKGCCKGQTGHHLMPDAWFTETGQRGAKSSGVCPGGYSEKKSPVVCAEGTSHSLGGSHSRMHKNTDTLAAQTMDDFSYDNARDAAVKAHRNTFPLSLCSSNCIKSQLDKEYKEKGRCDDGSDLKAVSSSNGSPLFTPDADA